uniref:TonB-dependent outer membrane receptor n=1 Tax=Triatoma infestans TaxID=30076 RepID=A0A170XB98_TRIIF
MNIATAARLLISQSILVKTSPKNATIIYLWVVWIIKSTLTKAHLSFIIGGQRTDRDHYTGIVPDDETEQQAFYAAPPYGISEVTTHQGGVQYNKGFDELLGGTTVLTGGVEYIYDDVFDEIDSYNYLIDQTTKNLRCLCPK